MAAFLVPNIQTLPSPSPRQSRVYQVEITPTASYRVTVTGQPAVFDEWIADLNLEEAGRYFPVGVALHGEAPGAEVLTVFTRGRCMVFNLENGYNLSRNVLVFLRDVCTCYGWCTDDYNERLMGRNRRLSLGRLTDIRSLDLVPQPNMGLGNFGFLVYKAPVPEPSADWTDSSRSARMNQLGETVMQANICLEVGGFCCSHAPPHNESLPRVFSSTFPKINRTEDMADRTLYQVTINTNQSLHVTYTNRASVLIEWLRSPGTMRINDDFIGIELTVDNRGRSTVMALAARNDCLVYSLSQGEDGLSRQVLAIGRERDSKLVGWHTGEFRNRLASVRLNVRHGRLLDVEDSFPVTHTYEDLSRLYLGYEMSRVSVAAMSPDEEDMMALAVQAFVYLRRAMDLAANNEDN